MALPIELQQDPELVRYVEELQQLRSELALAVSQIQSAAYSAKRSLGTLPQDIIDKIAVMVKAIEYLVIPPQEFSAYMAGTVTLDTYASFDTLDFYNELQLLQFATWGMVAALGQLTESRQQPLSAGVTDNGTAIDSLSDSEFLDQGFTQPVFDQEYDTRQYVIRQGDTLQGIAARELRDYRRWIDLAKINDVTEDDLVEGTAVGRTIKVPVLRTSMTRRRDSKNLVYESVYDGTTRSGIEQFLYGRDFDLDGDGNFIIDGGQDLRVVAGIRGVVANVRDRFHIPKGNLNPLHPSYGLLLLNDYGQVPYLIGLDRLLSDMEGQAAADPRVTSAVIRRSGVHVSGDSIRANLDLTLLNGGQEIEEITVNL